MVGYAIKCFVVTMGAVALVTTLAGRQARNADRQEFRFDAVELKDTTLWTQVTKEPYYISAAVDALCRLPTFGDYEAERRRHPHAGTYITVYVNNVGREAMFSKEPRRFPAGSVIVKEKVGTYSEGSAPLLYTVMTKCEPGYNSEVGDWEFSVVSGNGIRVEASGKLENCQTCHITKRDSDFVCRPYLKSK